MPFEIEMPHVGESVTEAVIEKWLKQPGDRVEKYEPIVEVVTDKVAMEVPAPATGELTKIVATEGDTVAMGAVIAEMEADDAAEVPARSRSQPAAMDSHPIERAAASAPKRPAASDSGLAGSKLRMAGADHVGSMITAANVGPTGGAFSDTSLGEVAAPAGRAKFDSGEQGSGSNPGFARLSPAVRRLIDQHGIDPASITGTGVGGRVTRADVLAAVGNGSEDVGVADGRLVKPTAIRRMIADHMTTSFREIPHAWSAVEVDVSGMVACRSTNRDRVQAEHSTNLTYLPFTLAVTAAALKSNPLLNGSWREDGILLHSSVNVGIAVAGKDGLVVPVVKEADTLSVLELARRLDGVVDRARNNRLSLDDVSGGTFTLNNTGALGSVWGGAIINHAQAAILTTEAIVKRPVVTDDDRIEVRPMMNICLSFDHRVIDGAEASKFLQDVKSGIEAISEDTTLE